MWNEVEIIVAFLHRSREMRQISENQEIDQSVGVLVQVDLRGCPPQMVC